ncbi:uncharacterized protein [Drosophila kikkawai]|uniref:Uncharacterized protein n=1 Tax=Drosophila kikkawai TaxID=30033 RepID=A0A6P4IPG4_DROKI|nr:uncharacterized protein LOC108076136 [Drosophila kikkawai]
MSRSVSQIYQFLLISQFIYYSTEVEYEFIPQDERYYEKCKDLPDALGMEELFDMTNLNIAMTEEGLQFSGNMTSTWLGLDPSDRIQMATSIQYFDRGTWVPTILNMLIPDFCKFLYDERQSWYTWSSHIINRKEIETECFKVPGTVFIFDTYPTSFRFGSGIYLKPGRYSLQVQFTAYDKFNKKRPTEVCYEIRGEFFKV